jgi:hypothetical protein
LSFYKKLEGGSALSTHLHRLIRVARTLGAGNDERASLIRLARPDLARMLPAEHERASIEPSLRSLRRFANELVRTRAWRDAVARAVELLYAVLEPDWTACAFEHCATGTLRRMITVGDHDDAFALNDEDIQENLDGGVHVLERDDVRIFYASICGRGRDRAIICLGCSRLRLPDQKSAIFLDTVAAMLEMRFGARSTDGPA